MNSQNITLRPYHNPKGVDESLVPKGFRFRYADEMRTKTTNRKLKYWSRHGEWAQAWLQGVDPLATYIVPVNA